jgi:RNA polymerase sigma factor (sigma-70 family)
MDSREATLLVTDLFESSYSMFVRYAFRATGSLDAAEDLAQEALMALYRAVREGKQVDCPKAWTFCVIRRLVSKQIRAHQQQTSLHEPVSVLDDLPAPSSVEFAHEVELDDLTRLFSVLTRREEEVTLLRMTAMKYREIAEELGISPKSVNTLLSRALRKLQKAAGVEPAQPSKSKYVEPVIKALQ